MSESVCLQCGKEMEYDWAPCPECGWKAPENWETPEEESEVASPRVMPSFRYWTKITAWVVLAAFVGSLLLYLAWL